MTDNNECFSQEHIMGRKKHEIKQRSSLPTEDDVRMQQEAIVNGRNCQVILERLKTLPTQNSFKFKSKAKRQRDLTPAKGGNKKIRLDDEVQEAATCEIEVPVASKKKVEFNGEEVEFKPIPDIAERVKIAARSKQKREIQQKCVLNHAKRKKCGFVRKRRKMQETASKSSDKSKVLLKGSPVEILHQLQNSGLWEVLMKINQQTERMSETEDEGCTSSQSASPEVGERVLSSPETCAQKVPELSPVQKWNQSPGKRSPQKTSQQESAEPSSEEESAMNEYGLLRSFSQDHNKVSTPFQNKVKCVLTSKSAKLSKNQSTFIEESLQDSVRNFVNSKFNGISKIRLSKLGECNGTETVCVSENQNLRTPVSKGGQPRKMETPRLHKPKNGILVGEKSHSDKEENRKMSFPSQKTGSRISRSDGTNSRSTLLSETSTDEKEAISMQSCRRRFQGKWKNRMEEETNCTLSARNIHKAEDRVVSSVSSSSRNSLLSESSSDEKEAVSVKSSRRRFPRKLSTSSDRSNRGSSTSSSSSEEEGTSSVGVFSCVDQQKFINSDPLQQSTPQNGKCRPSDNISAHPSVGSSKTNNVKRKSKQITSACVRECDTKVLSVARDDSARSKHFPSAQKVSSLSFENAQAGRSPTIKNSNSGVCPSVENVRPYVSNKCSRSNSSLSVDQEVRPESSSSPLIENSVSECSRLVESVTPRIRISRSKASQSAESVPGSSQELQVCVERCKKATVNLLQCGADKLEKLTASPSSSTEKRAIHDNVVISNHTTTVTSEDTTVFKDRPDDRDRHTTVVHDNVVISNHTATVTSEDTTVFKDRPDDRDRHTTVVHDNVVISNHTATVTSEDTTVFKDRPDDRDRDTTVMHDNVVISNHTATVTSEDTTVFKDRPNDRDRDTTAVHDNVVISNHTATVTVTSEDTTVFKDRPDDRDRDTTVMHDNVVISNHTASATVTSEDTSMFKKPFPVVSKAAEETAASMQKRTWQNERTPAISDDEDDDDCDVLSIYAESELVDELELRAYKTEQEDNDDDNLSRCMSPLSILEDELQEAPVRLQEQNVHQPSRGIEQRGVIVLEYGHNSLSRGNIIQQRINNMFKRLCYRFLSQECTKKTCYFKHSFPLVELEWESEILINVLQYGRIKKYKSFIDYVCEQLVWKALKQNQWYTCFGFLLNLKFPPIEIARFMKVPILDCDTNSMLELLDTCCSVIQMHLPFIHILSYFWDLFKQPLIKSVNVKPKIIHKLLLFCIQRDVDDFYMKVYATLKSMAPPVLEAIPRRLLMEFFGKVEGELPQPTVAGENELPSAAVARSYEVHRAPVPFGGGLSQPELPCDTPGLWLPDCNTTSRIAGTGTPDVPVAQKCLPNHSPLLRRELASDTTSRIVGTSSPDAASGRAPVTQKCLPDHSPLLRRELASDTMSRIASTSTADTASSRAPVTQKCLPDHSPLLRRELASDTTSRIASTSTADTASSRVPVTQKCLPNHSPLLRRDFSCDAPSRIASTSTADTASSRAPVTQKCLPNHSPLLRRELASDTTSRIASTSTADTASSRAPFTQKCLPNHSPLLQRELASDTTSRIASTSTADTASSRAPVTQKCLPNHSPLLRRELASDTMSRIASTSTADTASSRAPFTQKCLPNHSPLLQRELASDTTSRIASTSTADTASSRAPVTQKCLPNHSPLLRRELASDTTSRIVGTSSPDVASGRAPVTQKCLPNHSPLLRRELASDTTSRIVGTSSPDVASGRAPVTQKCLPNHSPLLRRELASDTTSRIVGTSSPDVASGRAPVAQKCLPDHSPLLRRDFSCDAPSRIASTSTADTASSRAPVTQKCLPNHSPLPRRDFPCNTPPPPNIWLPGRKSVSNKPEAPSAAVKWSPQCDTLPKKGMEPIKLKRTPYLKPSVLQNSCKFERKTWQKNTAELPRTDDKVELKRSVEDGDFEVALGMLEKWAGKAATSAEAHQVFIELQNMFLKTQIGFFQLLEISDFKVKPLMKKIMANFGMNRMLECMANNEWSHPMDIYKWMRENNICIEETQVTDSLKSPCTKVLSCAEVCIRNNNLTQAISLLKSKNLFSLDETCWKVKGSAEDKKVLHIMLFHILGLLLNTDVAKAHNLFMEIRKHREQQVEPDLIKWGVVILQELLRGKRYNMAVNLYASTEENLYNFLDTPTIRILLVALVQQNKERAAKSLFYRATMMGQYPHIKTEGNTKCARVLSYMTTEEMVLALKHLLHEIYNEAKGTVNMVNKYEARIYIQMRHLENDNHEFVYLQATVNTPSEARGRLVEALKSLTPPIGFDEPFRDCITLDLNSVQEYLLMLATSR